MNAINNVNCAQLNSMTSYHTTNPVI